MIKMSKPSNRYDHPRHNVLPIDVEKILIISVRNGNIEARNKLVNANIKFVISIAHKFKGRGIPVDDLINEGVSGLIKASECFDPTRSGRFISYAVWWIRQSMLKSIQNHGTQIKTPPIANFYQTIEKHKSSRNLAKTEAAEEALNNLKRIRAPHSLNAIQEAGFDLADETQDPSALSRRQAAGKQIFSLISTLGPIDQGVIRRYFGLETGDSETLEEIGHSIGMTREGVRQRKEKAMRILRTLAEKNNLAMLL